MPIYEYKCSSCGHDKEVLQKMSDAPLIECPACGKAALSKLISAAGFQLKGSGWYATDFKGRGAAPKSDKENADGKTKVEDKAKVEGKAADAGTASTDKPKEDKKSEAPASATATSPASQ